jgi:hypothetical protein
VQLITNKKFLTGNANGFVRGTRLLPMRLLFNDDVSITDGTLLDEDTRLLFNTFCRSSMVILSSLLLGVSEELFPSTPLLPFCI